MRLNVDNYRAITSKKRLSDEDVRKSTGLSGKALSWILENKYIEACTCELIADAIGCKVKDIQLPDSLSCDENVIEWRAGSSRATVTLSQRRTVNQMEKSAKSRPEECEIVARNKDGSMCAHIPVSWVKISPPREVTEEQREIFKQRMNRYHENHVTTR